MIALVSGATTTMRRYAHTGRFGRLYVPSNRNQTEVDLPWACDNGAFSEFKEDKFLYMLELRGGFPGCLWVAAPDVVGHAAPTLELYDEWEPKIRAAGLPVALVAQDGLVEADVPWDRIDCLFIGGSTEWKLGPALALCESAKKRGKWVHVGRVNGARRVKRLHCLGTVDSFDGSSLSKWPEVWLPLFDNLLATPQLQLEGTA